MRQYAALILLHAFLYTLCNFHTTVFTQNPDSASVIIHYYLNNTISELAALSVKLVTRISENSSFYQYYLQDESQLQTECTTG